MNHESLPNQDRSINPETIQGGIAHEHNRIERSSGMRRIGLRCFLALSMLAAFNAKIGFDQLPGGTRRKSATAAEHILRELKGKSAIIEKTDEDSTTAP